MRNVRYRLSLSPFRQSCADTLSRALSFPLIEFSLSLSLSFSSDDSLSCTALVCSLAKIELRGGPRIRCGKSDGENVRVRARGEERIRRGGRSQR